MEEIKLFIQQKLTGEKEYSLILLRQIEIKISSNIVQLSSDVTAKHIYTTFFLFKQPQSGPLFCHYSLVPHYIHRIVLESP